MKQKWRLKLVLVEWVESMLKELDNPKTWGLEFEKIASNELALGVLRDWSLTHRRARRWKIVGNRKGRPCKGLKSFNRVVLYHPISKGALFLSLFNGYQNYLLEFPRGD